MMDNNETKKFDDINTNPMKEGAATPTPETSYDAGDVSANAEVASNALNDAIEADLAAEEVIQQPEPEVAEPQMAAPDMADGEYAYTRDTLPSQEEAHIIHDAEVSDVGFEHVQTNNTAGDAEYVHMESDASHSPLPNDYAAGGVSGKTAVKKSHSRFSKLVATVLAAAIIGGCAGGAAGYFAGSSNSKQYVATVSSSQNNGVNVTYSEDGNMTISSIAEVAVPAVVGIYNIGTNTDFFGNSTGESAKGYGSGVIISSDGTIVTNYHVIEGSTRVTVVTNDGDEYEATVLGSDSNLDLAVLKINAKDLPYVDLADSDEVQVGDMAVAIGNPVDAMFAQTVTDGIISGVDRKLSSESGTIGYLQTNASINSGNSGGALLNGQAQLIGINSMKIMSTGVEGMGFAIPSNVVAEFVNKVVSGELAEETEQKPWLGISGYNLTAEIAAQLNTSYTSGILIAEVVDAGPASTAGLQSGDILIEIDGKEIKEFEDLSSYLDGKSPGDTVTLTVVRSNQTATVDVKLGTQAQVMN